MKRFLFPLLLCSLFLATGCDLSTTSGDDLLADVEAALNEAGITQEDIQQEIDNANQPETTSAPEDPVVVASGPIPSGICCGFLWKPISESTRNLAILLPQATRGRTQGIATISGSFGSESAPLRFEDRNGGRPHFFFEQPGAAYGRNVTVQVPLTDGSVYSVVIPDGAQRWE